MSLVRNHQMRVNAAQQDTHTATDETQRALRWLHTQRGILTGMQSMQAREAHKAEVLPEIAPYLQGVLDGDTGTPDTVVAHCAVWAIDAGNWPMAAQLGVYVIQHGLDMPDQFTRNAPTLVLDLLADAALAGRMPADVAPKLLADFLDLTEGDNMPDQSRAKTHKAIAYGLANKTTRAGDSGDWTGKPRATLELALQHLQEAEKLDEKSGVKKDIATVQKLLRPAPEAQQATEPQADKPAPKKPAAKNKAQAKT